MKKSHLVTSFLSLLLVTGCSCSVFHDGNSSLYLASNQEKKTNSLNGKKFYYLGSSVTLGMESGEEALPEFLEAIDGVSFQKEAKSGTTLKGTTSDDSYIARMVNSKKFNKNEKIDAFFIQLSTNDASKKNGINFGKVSAKNQTDLSSFDVSTTIGGLEYIINYVNNIWHTKIFIYSNAYFEDEGKKSVSYTLGSDYLKLVNLTCELEEKYNSIESMDVTFIDLFSDKDFNNISEQEYELYMFDAIHPTKAGYLKWWTPYIEHTLLEQFK